MQNQYYNPEINILLCRCRRVPVTENRWKRSFLPDGFWRLYYHPENHVKIICGDTPVLIPAGQLVLIPPRTKLSYGMSRDFKQFYIHFLAAVPYDRCEPGMYPIETDAAVSLLLEELIAEAERGDFSFFQPKITYYYRCMRTLILLSAVPGSGKSTWAKKYQAAREHTFIVSSDDIREELFGKAQDFRDEGLVWKTFQDRLNQYGAMYEDSTVIADATNLQNKYRKMYFDATPGFDKHILVIFDIPFDIAKKQNKMRSKERVVPEYAMDKLIAEWEDVSEEVKNLYDEVVYIRNFGTDIVRENLQSQFDEGKIK